MRRIIYPAFLLLISPNILFILIAYWTGDDRSLFNIDYLLPLLCFSFKNKIFKILGVIFFVFIFFIDVLLLALQHFPNLHFRDIFYLIGFLFSGPRIFLVFGAVLVLILAFEIIISWHGLKKISSLNILMIGLCILPINAGYIFLNNDRFTEKKLHFYNNPFAASNVFFFFKNQEMSFSNLSLLKATPYENATKPWTDAIKNHQALNRKLLLIIVESWGQPLNPAIQEDILKNLKTKSNEFEFFSQGSTPFQGTTVEGELRELCQLQPQTIDMLQIRTGFQNCLPNSLDSLGYETKAFHGSDSTMYKPRIWYPKAGINTTLLKEDFNTPAKCVSFDGICDWDILPFIKQSFTQDKKLFNYWLTLTSHYSYYPQDIHNTRFNCDTFEIPVNSDACHNLMLQAQLFDYIADFISSPEMRGVEIVIVGDHPPPLFNAADIAVFKTKEMSEANIGWIHFKTKEHLPLSKSLKN